MATIITRASKGTGLTNTELDQNLVNLNAEIAAKASNSNITGTVSLPSTTTVAVTTNSMPSIRPSLLLDFVNNTRLDSRVTFTRASTATRISARGLLESVDVNAARFDYDATTLACKGLLIEEQRTNLLLQSNNLFGSGTGGFEWQYGPGLVTADTQISPDGFLTADTITTTGSADTLYQSAAVTASTIYTGSVYVRLGTMGASDYKIAVYNNSTPGFIAVDITPTQIPTTTSWTRITYTFTTPVSCTSVRWYPFRNTSNTSGSTVYLWGAQLEAGAFATSYILTTTASVTRAADVATITGTNFSSWYNPVEGALYAESAPQSTNAGSYTIVEVGDGTASNRLGFFKLSTSGNASLAVLVGGITQVSTTNGTWSATGKMAGAYKLNDFASAFNGGTAVNTDNSGTLPVVTQLTIGRRQEGASILNGHLARIAYYPVRLPNKTLRALTT